MGVFIYGENKRKIIKVKSKRFDTLFPKLNSKNNLVWILQNENNLVLILQNENNLVWRSQNENNLFQFEQFKIFLFRQDHYKCSCPPASMTYHAVSVNYTKRVRNIYEALVLRLWDIVAPLAFILRIHVFRE